MSTHSVADAKNHLSELIQRALSGETVTITRHGTPVAQITPIKARQERRMTQADIEWLRSRRVKLAVDDQSAASIVERMRDEDDERLFRR